ncbi:MAG: ATP-binding protein [Oscillospiraceae bacterium]
MFIGREKELDKLNKLYSTGKFQMPVVYGRRRVGKTALLNEFVKDKDAIFFTAIESSKQQNIENLSRCIFEYEHHCVDTTFPVYNSFQEALEYVFKLAEEKQVVFIIDEYPYAAKSDKSLSSVIQSLIDKNKDKSKLFMILCGSSMSFMEEQVLGYESPLYGRRTAQFKIFPFDFEESCKIFSSFTKTELACIYGIVGGTPQYLLQIDDGVSLKDNILNKILDTSAYLFEEPGNLLKQEVREAALYNAVITAIANGSTKVSEIATKVGEETSACTACLKKLMSLGIIKRETPFGEKEGRKSLYIIDDSLFRFWYRFIPSNISALQNDMSDVVYTKIEKDLNQYMGQTFEEICRQYLWRENRRGNTPITFTELDRWWGTDPTTHTQEEIDIVASDGVDMIFAECKWKNELTDKDVLEKLMSRSDLLKCNNKYLYLFSKSGFTDKCAALADSLGNVTLVKFEDMFS